METIDMTLARAVEVVTERLGSVLEGLTGDDRDIEIQVWCRDIAEHGHPDAEVATAARRIRYGTQPEEPWGVGVSGPQMFSMEGDDLLREKVAALAAAMRDGSVARRDLVEHVRLLEREVRAAGHAEVTDTEPQAWLADVLSAVCRDLMWAEVSRWDW